MKIQWLGDIALTAQYMDPANHRALEANAKDIAMQLQQADLRIANWEAPLMGDQGLNTHKRPALHTNKETASKASALKLDVALLANNHTFDCLESGFVKTVSFLASAGISVVGAGATQTDATAPLLIDVCGTPVALLAYVDESTNPRLPECRPMHLNWLQPERVLDEVAHWAARHKTVLVHFHCGSDFVSLPHPLHRILARRAIEAGATVVACYHPHRIQGYERIGHGLVIYSLGNFLAGSIYPWPRFTQPTAVATCEIEDRKVVGLAIQHLILRKGRLFVDTSGRGARIHSAHNRRISATDDQYVRSWTRAEAIDVALVRPWHFLRRHKNPLKIVAAIEKRHVQEAWNVLVSAAKNLFGRQEG